MVSGGTTQKDVISVNRIVEIGSSVYAKANKMLNAKLFKASSEQENEFIFSTSATKNDILSNISYLSKFYNIEFDEITLTSITELEIRTVSDCKEYGSLCLDLVKDIDKVLLS